MPDVPSRANTTGNVAKPREASAVSDRAYEVGEELARLVQQRETYCGAKGDSVFLYNRHSLFLYNRHSLQMSSLITVKPCAFPGESPFGNDC